MASRKLVLTLSIDAAPAVARLQAAAAMLYGLLPLDELLGVRAEAAALAYSGDPGRARMGCFVLDVAEAELARRGVA